jgi:hypothetical protein
MLEYMETFKEITFFTIIKCFFFEIISNLNKFQKQCIELPCMLQPDSPIVNVAKVFESKSQT